VLGNVDEDEARENKRRKINEKKLEKHVIELYKKCGMRSDQNGA
jgi:hypothetical protein